MSVFIFPKRVHTKTSPCLQFYRLVLASGGSVPQPSALGSSHLLLQRGKWGVCLASCPLHDLSYISITELQPVDVNGHKRATHSRKAGLSESLGIQKCSISQASELKWQTLQFNSSNLHVRPFSFISWAAHEALKEMRPANKLAAHMTLNNSFLTLFEKAMLEYEISHSNPAQQIFFITVLQYSTGMEQCSTGTEAKRCLHRKWNLFKCNKIVSAIKWYVRIKRNVQTSKLH